jgi:radical SAM superfamily enzyme YgiQ (UPF0313 family)
MELPRRDPGDVYVPEGAYGRLVQELQTAEPQHAWSPLIVYPFDFRTRVMPFRWLDHRVVPCGVRSLASSLLECGFHKTRTVLQQWTPNFLSSAAVQAGYKIDILLVSSMGLHAEEAYRLVKDAHTLGDDRPLILMGGPKAIYEPEDCFNISEELVGAGVDVAVTGESFVLLEFLRLLSQHAATGEHPRDVFERVRAAGLLNDVPGLVYRPTEADPEKPFLINTGVQRLVQDLDELPMPLSGYMCLEPPHRKKSLSNRVMTLKEVRKKTMIAAMEVTHGCRFNCDFCPIPAYQQKTWRHKSPERVAAEMKQLGEAIGYRYFFGTDDNFFNNRESVQTILSAMANGNVNGVPFRKSVHFITEATEADVYKNRDLLPLAREAGLQTIYFGIEDLNAKLINKGQTVSKTKDLFADMTKHEIAPYSMMIHHDDQPFWSRDRNQLGVINQAAELFKLGSVGYHTTYITPGWGARNMEPMFQSGNVLAQVGNQEIPEAFYDGNHVVASRHGKIWIRQIQLWLAYLGFYNPVNFLKTMFKDLRDRQKRRRFKWQIIGMHMIPMTVLKTLPFTFGLMFRRVRKHTEVPARCTPMVDAHSGELVKWSVDWEPEYEVNYTPPSRAEKPQSLPIAESLQLPILDQPVKQVG